MQKRARCQHKILTLDFLAPVQINPDQQMITPGIPDFETMDFAFISRITTLMRYFTIAPLLYSRSLFPAGFFPLVPKNARMWL
jgi:hypothetical protein